MRAVLLSITPAQLAGLSALLVAIIMILIGLRHTHTAPVFAAIAVFYGVNVVCFAVPLMCGWDMREAMLLLITMGVVFVSLLSVVDVTSYVVARSRTRRAKRTAKGPWHSRPRWNLQTLALPIFGRAPRSAI